MLNDFLRTRGFKIFRLVFAAIASVVLIACANGPMQASDIASTQRMGVVSNLGSTLHLTTAGTTVFTNKYAKADVESWQIDRFAIDTVVTHLSGGRPFSVAPLDTSALPSTGIDFVAGSPIWALAKSQGFDRLLSVHAFGHPSFPKMEGGYGLYKRMFLGSGRACPYASFRVSIYDVATMKTVSWDLGLSIPCLRASDSKFVMRDSFSEYSESEKVALRQEIEWILSYGLLDRVSFLVPR